MRQFRSMALRTKFIRLSLSRTNVLGAIHTIARPSSQHPSDKRMFSQLIMPAEWHEHRETLTVWPDIVSVEDEDVLRSARAEVSAISNAIAHFEPVRMYTQPQSVDLAKSTVSKNVTVVGMNVNELWVRDTGPLIVQNAEKKARALKLNFNYWGGKLPQRGDEHAAQRIASNLNIPCIEALLQAEGGGIDVDGEGTLLATESSIINPNRNPGLAKKDLEEALQAMLGVKKIIWLPGLKDHDITDYHIDAFARFTSPGVVLLSKSTREVQSAEFEAYAEAKKILKDATDASGRQLRVFEVAEPDLADVPGAEYGSTCASYVNFLLVNGGVIMPRFGVKKTDSEALEIFQHIFPSKMVVQVDLNALPRLGGGIHCATQQVPSL